MTGELLLREMEQNPQDVGRRAIYADWLAEQGRHEEEEFLRKVEMTGKEFNASIIARDDSGGYDPSGWIACVVTRGGVQYAALTSFGHCSCYGTWESVSGGGISDYFPENEVRTPSFNWIGSLDGLIEMARNHIDPSTMKQIDATHGEDVYLVSVYRMILAKYDTCTSEKQ